MPVGSDILLDIINCFDPVALGDDCWGSSFSPQQDRLLDLIAVCTHLPCFAAICADYKIINLGHNSLGVWGDPSQALDGTLTC